MALGPVRAASFVVCCGLGFLLGVELRSPFPPGAPERIRAIGPLDGLSDVLARAFDPGAAFEPLPRPGTRDWLAAHPERGQTFSGYVRSSPHRPDGDRRRLVLLPLASSDGSFVPDLARIAEYAERFFSVETRVDPRVAPDRCALGLREHPATGEKQAHAPTVLAFLESRLPADAFAVLGVTRDDLFPDPEWHFVFGQASLRNRVGVMSLARLGPLDRREGLRRALKLASHELGHTFGLVHCVYFRCLMNGSNSLAEMDGKPMHLCPVCLRKLHHATGAFDPVERYRGLLGYYRVAGLGAEAAFVEKRLEEIAAARR